MKKLLIIALFLQVFAFGAMAQVQEKDGYVVIEMESTTSPLGLWKKIQKGDSTFIESASGGVHLEFTGNNPSSGPATSPLEYTFKIKTAGTYHLMIRGSKRLAGAPGDKCNDCFVRVEGDYTSPYTGAPEKEPDYKGLSTNQKIFGGLPHPKLGWSTTLDYLGHIKKKPLYNFKAGETYKIIFSGRAQRFNSDFFILYNTNMLTTEQAMQISPTGKIELIPMPEKAPAASTKAKHAKPEQVKPVEAAVVDPNCWSKGFDGNWDLSKPEGYKAQAILEVPRKAFQINTIKQPHNEWATAKTTYDGESGTFNVIFTSLQETDGECFYKVLIAGKTILEYQNPRILNTTTKEYSPYVVGIKGITITKGAAIQIDFKSNSNGLVPEKDDFGWARARWSGISIGNCDTITPNKWIVSDAKNSAKGNAKGNAKGKGKKK